MAEKQTNEALEKLNRGIQESRQLVQQQTMKLAQDYFGDSVNTLKREINESRKTLEDLPDQIPGGRDEAFQVLFQELMDNYANIESCLDEARGNVTGLDTDQLRKQGEIDATDAARRHAREMGVDLTEIEGTGSEGRITADDVKSQAEEEDESGEELKASDAARRTAEELGVDLSRIQGTGSEGLITVKDVRDQATEKAGQAVQKVQDTAGQAAGQAQDAVGGVTDQVGQAAQGVQDTAGQAAGDGEEPRATNAARRKAEELGVDLSRIQGSGSGGLITIKDVVGS